MFSASNGQESKLVVCDIKSEDNKRGDVLQFVNRKGMHYIEFQSNIIKVINKVLLSQLHPKDIFQEFVKTEALFKKTDNGDVKFQVAWPYRNTTRDISIVLSEDAITGKPSLDFYAKKRFLSLFIQSHNEMIVRTYRAKSQWNNKEIIELVNIFNQIFNVKKITYIRKKSTDGFVELKQKGEHRYNKSDFSSLIGQYAQSGFAYRINNVILKNAHRQGNDFTLYLNWPVNQSKTHLLKARFSRADEFKNNYSWVMGEKCLLSFPEYSQFQVQSGQSYYGFNVYEVNKSNVKPKKPDINIISLWMTSDAQFGEISNIVRGEVLSGNDVLDIYRYFDSLFKIKNTFICDASNLTNEDESIRVRFRVIMKIATGKTWYESKIPGVSLFECKDFDSYAIGKVTQNISRYSNALKELQQLPLQKWYEMLDANKQKILHELYKDNLGATLQDEKAVMFDMQATLQSLTIKLYNDSKEKKCITPEIAKFVKLLYDDMDLPHSPCVLPDVKASDYWVKSRVHELLWGGYYWVKKPVPEIIDEKSIAKRLTI